MREPLSKIDLSSDDDFCFPAPPAPILIEPWHPMRAEAEAFIAARFLTAFGARAKTTYPTLAALFGDDGRIAAAAGLRLAEAEPLFLERYLDEPVEQAVARAFGRPVARDSIAEIGSLAASDVGGALSLFGALATWLAGPGRRRYAVATARPELVRLLRRSGFRPRPVADADPACLGAAADDWGAYYGACPRVFCGEIGVPASLSRLRRRLQARSARRSEASS